MGVSVINQSIKFFTIFLLAFNVFAGGDDRDEEYYEALDEELATFEAQLAEDLANQAALEAFQQKLAEEKAAAAASTAAYQSQLEYDDKVQELMDALQRDLEIAAFEAQLEAELAAQDIMAEISADEERAKRLAEFQAKLEAEKAAAARSTAIYQARVQQEQIIKDRQAQLALERELSAFEAQLEADLAKQAAKEAFEEWYSNFLENKAAEEALEKELAAFEAQLEAELAAEEMMAEIEEELARQAALEAFQQKLADERAAAAASTSAYQQRLLEEELEAFEAQLEADLAAQAAEKAAAEAAAAVAVAEAAAAVAAAEAAAAAQAAAAAAAAPQISLSGTASVTYDDNGTAASSTTYDADLTFTGSVGTVGGTNTTVTIGMDVNGANAAITGADLATKIGPVTIAADMFDEVSLDASTVSGGQRTETTDTSVTVSLDVPVGDMTIGLDNSGNVVLSGTFSGVTVSHTVGDTTTTTASAAIAGIDMSVTNKAGATTWTLDTTVSGVDLTLTSGQKITAAFGLAGNTLTVTRVPAVVAHTGTVADNDWDTAAVASYSTAAISRDLTSGATLTATYSTKDDSLTLKAAVTF